MTLKRTHTLKQLESRRTKLLVEIEILNLEQKDFQRKHTTVTNKFKSIERQIKNLKETNLEVSEHAMLRYIERVMQIDLSIIRDNILTNENKLKIKILGNGEYPLKDKFKIVVKNNLVVTIK